MMMFVNIMCAIMMVLLVLGAFTLLAIPIYMLFHLDKF